MGLYACIVRRLRTEKRKCRKFIVLLRSYAFSFCSCFRGLSCCCFAPVLCLLLWGCGLCCCWWLSFPSDGMTKRKGGLFGSSSLCSWVMGLLCKTGLSVFVKFVIIRIYFLGYTFIRVRVFVIFLPLLKKVLKNTLYKFPRAELLFYAFVYVV